MPFAFYRKPNIAVRGYLIDKFEERAMFEQLIAYLILNEGEKMKKITIVYLRVT